MAVEIRAPMFIIGAPRSGTSILYEKLAQHPDVTYISKATKKAPGSLLLTRFLMHFRKSMQPTEARAVWNRFWRGREDATLGREDAHPRARRYLRRVVRNHIALFQKPRFLAKYLGNSFRIEFLDAIFPDAIFIHIIRDGRDVALSTLDKWGSKEFHVDIYYAARNWVRRIRQAQEAGTRLGTRLYYELRYEQLVRQPEQELQKLCDFLGEEYLPQMAHQDALAQQRIEPGSFHDPVRRPPNTTRLARWRREMSPRDLRLFQRIAGDTLTALGYEPAQAGAMSAPEQVRLAALALKYETLQAGRRVLQAAGLMPPI